VVTATREESLVEISVLADVDAVDDIVRLLERHCQGGTAVEEILSDRERDYKGRLTVKGYVPASDTDTQRKIEIALLLLSRDGSISEPEISILRREDWAEAWKQYFTPLHVGQRTVIVPTWHTYTPRPGQIVIRLDPGMAFGTGLHPTTRLCMIAAERLVRADVRVLDVGTGSGILAILAALLGAEAVLGLDTDPIAVQVARENVALNGVEGIVTAEQGTLGGRDERTGGAQYDLVLANILAEVIIDMAVPLARAVAPGGVLVASGILNERADRVADALTQVGLPLEGRLSEGDWTALITRKA